MGSYYRAVYAVAIGMLTALEVGLHLPARAFTSRCIPSASDLRLTHYPSIHARNLQDGCRSRIWPHTDFGLITPLFQDGVGGLEVENRDVPGTYLPVPRGNPYEMVLNVSDTLERWTNGFLESGVHRVSMPTGTVSGDSLLIPERYSVAFFFKAERSQRVGPLAQFLKEGEEQKFDDITALEFQRRLIQTTSRK